MKMANNYGGTLIVSIVMLIILTCGFAFGSEKDSSWELTPFVDVTGTIHGGIGEHYDGFAMGMGFGCEFLYAPTGKFALGPFAKSSVAYEVYSEDIRDGLLLDEYGLWSLSVGGIVYMGNSFYMGLGIVYNADVFYTDTYIHDYDGNDTSVDKADYEVDEIDYALEIGFRTDFHAGVYLMVTTHFVETETSFSKYQLYAGVRFFF